MPSLPTTKPDNDASRAAPRTVLAAKKVDLALVTYIDEHNQQRTTLAAVGDQRIHMFNARSIGMGKEPTPEGLASDWLALGVLKVLGKVSPDAKMVGGKVIEPNNEEG